MLTKVYSNAAIITAAATSVVVVITINYSLVDPAAVVLIQCPGCPRYQHHTTTDLDSLHHYTRPLG